MKPEEIAALRQLSEWLQEPACGEDMLASENVRKIVIAAKSVGPLLEHIDLQAEQITQANHRYTELQNVCDDQEKEIKRLREVAIPDAVDAERDRWLHDYSQKVDEITRLQKVISEPVESFGTPELLEWANGLQKIIADYPESERGELPFCMLMGSHLEKFAKSWNSPAMKRLEDALVEERAAAIMHGASFCLVACTDEDVLGDEESCEHVGNCEMDVCPNANWYRTKAREQLREERFHEA